VPNDPLEVADPSGLTDTDWAEINRLRQIYERDGRAAGSL
jgi:hypothetical protein